MPEDADDLEHDLKYILEEARVVIPGVQTLLGFQLIAVFNQLFPEKLSQTLQHWHLASIGFTTVAMVLIMSPAAYHRFANHEISKSLVRLSSLFLMAGMFVLASGISIDLYLVAFTILQNCVLALVFAGLLFLLFLCQWFVLPWVNSTTKQ